MAGTIKGITIELDGKTTKLTAALKEVNTPAKTLQTSLNRVNTALKLDPTNTELLSEKQKILASYVEVTRDKLEKMESVQDQIKQQYANGEIDQGAYLDFQKELEATRTKLENLEKQQKEFGSVIQQQMEAAGKKVSELGSKVSDVGTSITKGVTTPIVAVGTAATAAFAKVDDGVDIIVKATGASGEALESLAGSYKKLASELPVDFEIVASAVGEVNTRFHTTGDELEEQTTLLLKFSEITGTDVVQSADDADKALKAFGESSDQLQGFLGLVAAKAQQTGINAQTLLQDVTANAAVFKELDFTLEESINLMAQLDENGVDVSTALAGLKKAVTNLTEAGLDEADALQTVIDQIKNAATETEALQLAQETFGTKGAAEMATAIREGRLDIEALATTMEECASVVEDTFANTVGDASDEAKTAMNALTVAGSELGGTISDMLAPCIMDVAELIRNATQYLSGLDDEQKKHIVTIAAIVAAIGPVLTVGGKVISGVGSLIAVLGKIPTAISAVQTGFSAVSGVMSGVFSGALSAVGSGLSFLAANPIVLVIAAIAGIIAILVTAYNKCEWFRDGVNAAIEKVREIWSAGCEGIKSILSGLAQSWDNAMTGVQIVTSTVMDAARATVQEKLSNIKSAYEENGGGIKGIVAATMTGIQEAQTLGLDFIDNLTGGKLTSIAETFRSKMASVKTSVSSVMDNIKGTFSDKIEAARAAVSQGIENIKNCFNFDWHLPELKLPHISVTGDWSFNPPKVPSFSIEWYKEGGILSGAQIFGAMGDKWLGGGEAGPEAVLPLYSFYEELSRILEDHLGSQGGGSTQFNQYNTYNSPKDLSPAECARRTRNETRKLLAAVKKA